MMESLCPPPVIICCMHESVRKNWSLKEIKGTTKVGLIYVPGLRQMSSQKVYNPQLADSCGKWYSNGIVRIIVIVLVFWQVCTVCVNWHNVMFVVCELKNIGFNYFLII